MIIMEMGGMASRMTQQIRNDAAKKVERWRQVIEIVRQAEQQAGVSINLPPQLTASANRAVSTIPSADYVTAVGIINKAIDATHQVFETGIRSLQSEIQTCIEGLQKANDGLKRLQHEQARRQKESSSREWDENTAYQKTCYSNLPTEPSFMDGAKIGCVGAPIIFVIALVFNFDGIAKSQGPIIGGLLIIPTYLLILLGWLIIPVTLRLVYMASSKKVDTRVRTMERSLANEHRLLNDELMRQTQPDLISLEQTIASLIVKRQKAEVALGFLTAKQNELV
jgi:hypothetical protein